MRAATLAAELEHAESRRDFWDLQVRGLRLKLSAQQAKSGKRKSYWNTRYDVRRKKPRAQPETISAEARLEQVEEAQTRIHWVAWGEGME